MLTFYHGNHSVADLDASVAFYQAHFGLEAYRRIDVGPLQLVFMKDAATDFRLELTWHADAALPYDLGCREFHLAFYTDEFEQDLARHRAAGIVHLEELEHGLYFVEDPDGYLVEIVKRPP